MKTILKILLLFALAFALTLAYLKWRDRDVPVVEPLTAIAITEAQAAVEVLQREARTGEMRLDGADLRQILMASLAESKSGRTILENSVDIRATVDDAGIEAGVILATAGLVQRLEGSDDRKLERLAKILEFMPGDGVFLGARGIPIARDGQLSLDTATLELHVGPLTVSPEELADRVGLTAERIAEELVLGVGGVSFESVRVENETLVLETRPVS